MGSARSTGPYLDPIVQCCGNPGTSTVGTVKRGQRYKVTVLIKSSLVYNSTQTNIPANPSFQWIDTDTGKENEVSVMAMPRIHCRHDVRRSFPVDGEVANLLRTWYGFAAGKLPWNWYYFTSYFYCMSVNLSFCDAFSVHFIFVCLNAFYVGLPYFMCWHLVYNKRWW